MTNQQYSPQELAQALSYLQGIGANRQGSNSSGKRNPNPPSQSNPQQPVYIPSPNAGFYGPAPNYQVPNPNPLSNPTYQPTAPTYIVPPQTYAGGEEDSLIPQMVGQIESNLRPEGVEALWLELGNLILRRQRINRFELLKGIGFYTLAFCMPWLVVKALWFGKAIAGTAFLIISKSIFPVAALVLVGALMFIYREPTKMLTLLEIIIGFIISLVIFSLL
jgi:hypothetical protein